MKSKLRGLLILVAAIAVAAVYYFAVVQKPAVTEISGYLGGEKTGLFDDEEFSDIMEKDYNLKISYSKAGSLDMVSADLTGRDYLFPSSQVALELYTARNGSPKRSEIIFNTPIVFYTHRDIADALEANGLVTDLGDGSRGIDVKKFVQLVLDDKKWTDIGVDQLYGAIKVSTTDPVRSNSGNMFAGLLANILTDEGVADQQNIDEVLPDVQSFFRKSGYMESSSGDLFSQFLRTGEGAKPIMAGYESQILEFAVENPDDWEQLKDEIVILYPVPTVWSSHPFIALDEAGSKAIDALLDEKVQTLAWEKHGFRTGVSGASADISKFNVPGLLPVVKSVVSMPDAATMQDIIDALQNL